MTSRTELTAVSTTDEPVRYGTYPDPLPERLEDIPCVIFRDLGGWRCESHGGHWADECPYASNVCGCGHTHPDGGHDGSLSCETCGCWVWLHPSGAPA